LSECASAAKSFPRLASSVPNRQTHQASRKRGYDAHKKISGRKWHIAVDNAGRLLAMNLTPPDAAYETGAELVPDAPVKRWLCVKPAR